MCGLIPLIYSFVNGSTDFNSIEYVIVTVNIMSAIAYNLAPLFTKLILRQKYLCIYKIQFRTYNVLFFGSDSIALRSLQKVNEFR